MNKLKERQVPPPPVWVDSVSLIQDRLWKQYNALYVYGADYYNEMSNEDQRTCHRDPEYMQIGADIDKVLNIIEDLDRVRELQHTIFVAKQNRRKKLVSQLGYDPHSKK